MAFRDHGQTGAGLWCVPIRTVVEFSKQRQAGPTRRLQRTLEPFSPVTPRVGQRLREPADACKERTLRRDNVGRWGEQNAL